MRFHLKIKLYTMHYLWNYDYTNSIIILPSKYYAHKERMIYLKNMAACFKNIPPHSKVINWASHYN